MALSAGLGLAAAQIVYRNVERASERTADREKSMVEARAIALQMQQGADHKRLEALQALLPSDQIEVLKRGRPLFVGPVPETHVLELQVRAPFSGGEVLLRDYSSPGAPATDHFLLISAGLLLLVIGVAVGTATLLTRPVRDPVSRAIRAADRVAQGDFTARVGESGPAELASLARAFDSMASRLERADTDQRQFLADVAHEIATPLHSISGFALALADGTADGENERAEAGAIVQQESQRLAALLTDLRELTRLDIAEHVRAEQIDIDDFANRLETRYRPVAEARSIALELSSCGGTITSDGRLLDTIATNLLSNALRYTPAGGGVSVDIQLDRDELAFGVTDTGPGISPQDQERVFERLYRVDQTRERGTGGSGLGLAIASRAAASLGGRIELTSQLGRGSTFHLRVPTHFEPSTPAGTGTTPATGTY